VRCGAAGSLPLTVARSPPGRGGYSSPSSAKASPLGPWGGWGGVLAGVPSPGQKQGSLSAVPGSESPFS